LKKNIHFPFLIIIAFCAISACSKKRTPNPSQPTFTPTISVTINGTSWVANSFQNSADSTKIYINGINDSSHLQITMPLSIKQGIISSKTSFRFFNANSLHDVYIGLTDSVIVASNSNHMIAGTFRLSVYNRWGAIKDAWHRWRF